MRRSGQIWEPSAALSPSGEWWIISTGCDEEVAGGGANDSDGGGDDADEGVVRFGRQDVHDALVFG